MHTEGLAPYDGNEMLCATRQLQAALKEAEVVRKHHQRPTNTLAVLANTYERRVCHVDPVRSYNRLLRTANDLFAAAFHWLTAVAPLTAGEPSYAGEVEWKGYVAAGDSAYKEGGYRSTARILKRALRETNGFDRRDPRFARTLPNLAALYRRQGQHAEAAALDRRSLCIMEETKVPNDPDVATSLNVVAGRRWATLIRWMRS